MRLPWYLGFARVFSAKETDVLPGSTRDLGAVVVEVDG